MKTTYKTVCICLYGDDAIEEMLNTLVVSPIHVKAPCGYECDYTSNNFPKKTTPCPCGNPTEFLVEYVR